jgi:hypothetical protein
MKTFEDLEFKPNNMGIAARTFFPNNYGVSVIQNPYSYGNEDGLYELAVIYTPSGGDDFDIHYNNPVAQGDVRGCLTPEDVTELMKQVSDLTDNN